MLMGQKVEASALRVSAVARRLRGHRRRQNQRHAGHDRSEQEKRRRRRRIALAGDDRRSRAPPARHRFRRRRYRHDSRSRLAARIGDDGKDPPMGVDADLTPVKIDNLLPGWVKPAGKPAHATYTLVKTGQSVHIDDLTIAGSGTNVKGSVELDGAERHRVGEFPGVQPVGGRQGLAQGRPRQRRRAARGDARRRFRRHQFREVLACRRGAGQSPSTSRPISISTSSSAPSSATMAKRCAGSISSSTRRSGHIRSFAMNAKIGRDTPLNGDLRLRSRDNHQVIYFETDDAGALVPLHRHVSAHVRRADVGGDGPADAGPPAADRHALYPQFRRARRTRARSHRLRRARPDGTAACSFPNCIANSRACPGAWRCATAWCADRWWARPSKGRSTTSRTTCICAARSCRSTASTTCSGKSRSSGCSSAPAATRVWSASPTRRPVRPARRASRSIR